MSLKRPESSPTRNKDVAEVLMNLSKRDAQAWSQQEKSDIAEVIETLSKADSKPWTNNKKSSVEEVLSSLAKECGCAEALSTQQRRDVAEIMCGMHVDLDEVKTREVAEVLVTLSKREEEAMSEG
jgi:hypothetical protein